MPSVDKEKCIGCGLCVGTCPAGFEFDEDRKAQIKDASAPCIADAAAQCPQDAISVE